MRTYPIFSNPEFQRNLWQELTKHRLIGGIIILSILAWLNYASGKSNTFYWITFGIICIWGIKAASESIQEECQHGTWDYQRMSTVSPFGFTWGKLLGSTSYTWYLAGICLVYFVGLGLYLDEPLHLLINQYFIFMLCGLAGQYIALTFSLNAIQFGRDKQYSFRYFMTAFIMVSIFCTMLTTALNHEGQIEWYHMAINTYPFLLIFAGLVLGWSVLGAYRLIQTEFQYKLLPYAWTGFCLFWILYMTGFDQLDLSQTVLSNLSEDLKSSSVFSRVYVAFLTSSLLVYISLFSERYQIVNYRKILSLFLEKKYTEILFHLPRWIIASAFFIVLYVLVIFFGNIEIALNTNIDSIDNTKVVIQGFVFGTSAVFLTIRDILLIHFFYFSDNPKRAALSTILYMVLLYFVIPSLLVAINAKMLSGMFLPSPKNLDLVGWTGLSFQIALLAWLVWRRFARIKSA